MVQYKHRSSCRAQYALSARASFLCYNKNMNNKEKQIKALGTISIIFSILVIIPSVILLLSMLTGTGRQVQYGYSMYSVMLVFLGTVPSLLSIILGIITYSKYRKNKQICHNSEKIAFFSLLLSISSAIIMVLDLLLDTFAFP